LTPTRADDEVKRLLKLFDRRVRHVTPRYVWDRSRLWIWEQRFPSMPWLTQQAISLLNELLRDTDRALEWGSGRSTGWIASRVAELTSVEHDPGWFAKVSSNLDGQANITRLLVPCPPSGEAAECQEYVAVADRFEDRSLDFALVDGLHRDRCVLRIIPKIAPGGLLVVDNINWFIPSRSRSPSSIPEEGLPTTDSWREAIRELAAWRRIWTSNGVTDTAIWIRPSRT
jgi:hypothetical protein